MKEPIYKRLYYQGKHIINLMDEILENEERHLKVSKYSLRPLDEELDQMGMTYRKWLKIRKSNTVPSFLEYLNIVEWMYNNGLLDNAELYFPEHKPAYYIFRSDTEQPQFLAALKDAPKSNIL